MKQSMKLPIRIMGFLIISNSLMNSFSCAYTPAILPDKKNPDYPPIAEMAWVELGGVKQFVLIRGKDSSKPVLLYLHGGPGNPETGWMRYFHSWMEDYFVVAIWEQRGSGKSVKSGADSESISRASITSDGLELSAYLLKRFQKKKIYLMGTSWGGMLGMYMIHRQPDLFESYIAVAPAVNIIEQENRGYRFVRSEAIKRNNKKAIRELDELGPPHNGVYPGKELSGLRLQRKWATKFGGMVYGSGGVSFYLMAKLLFSDEYSLVDPVRYAWGIYFTISNMLKDLPNANLFIDVPSIEIPVHFILGRHDRIVHFDIVMDYYSRLQARGKTMTIFENSAHGPIYEEPELFKKTVLKFLVLN